MECLNTRLRALEYASREAVVDVFTVDGKGGNPCPVVLDASSMTPDAMRAVARAHGHESAFVLPVGDAESDFTLRFFVPGHEMEMCGHATLGTLWLMRQADVIDDRRVRIRTRSGIVLADIKDGNIRLSQPAATVRALEPAECRHVLDVLGLRDDMLATPLLCNASTSRPKTLIPLASVESLHRLQPRFAEMEALCDAIESTGLYPFARVKAAGMAFEARQFPKASGYPEDAATGIAATALTGALDFFGIDVAPGATVTIIQGRAMGRTSRLQVTRGESFHHDDSPMYWLGGAVTAHQPFGT